MRSLGPGAPPPAPIPVPACPPPPSVPTSCQIPFRNTSPACLPSSARPGPDWPPPRDTSQGSGGPAPASGPWRGPRVAAPGHPTHSACLPPPRAASPPPGPGPAASRPHAVCGLHPLSSISPGLSPRLLGRWVPDAGPLLPLRSHLPRRGPPSHRASPLSWRCSAGPPSPGASLPEPWPPSDGLRRRPQSGPVGPSGLRSWR